MSMVNVSKKKVDEKIRAQMNSHFAELFTFRLTKKEVSALLNEILTPAEQTTLLKRVAAIGMLAAGTEVRDVARTLSLSTRTVLNFKKGMHKKQFPILWKQYHKRKVSIFDLLSSKGHARIMRASLQKRAIRSR